MGHNRIQKSQMLLKFQGDKTQKLNSENPTHPQLPYSESRSGTELE